ncbi:MAG: dolichyl-phosphate-mannose--protein mannosyltransferase [Mycobacteriales bacterium]
MTATLRAAEADQTAPPTTAPTPPAERLTSKLPSDAVTGWVTTLVIGLIAGLTRLWAVDFPHLKIFDEAYYPPNAQQMLRQGYETSLGRLFVVHPPLGKWCIAIGIKLFGDNTVGWRVPTGVAGTIAVIILIRVVRRMTGSTLFGGIAGLLLALDGLSVVMSRTSLLDIFIQTFVIAGFACLVVDRDVVRARLLEAIMLDPWDGAGRPPVPLGPRPWRLAGGILLGASCGVKWSGVYFLAGFAILSVCWDRAAYKAAGVRKPTRTTAVRALPAALWSLGVMPIVAYLGTWTGWFLGENGYDRHWAATHPSRHFGFVPGALRSLWHFHAEMLTFHESLGSYHPYRSQPWAWLVDGRPVDFYYPGTKKHPVTGCGASSCVRQINALGTPAVWWAFVPAILWMLWILFSRRDWRAGVVLMAFAAGWGAWLENIGRTMFFFYMIPLVPFLAMGVTLALGDVLGRAGAGDRRRIVGLALVGTYLFLVILDFAFMWPVFIGLDINQQAWQNRMWFSSWI